MSGKGHESKVSQSVTNCLHEPSSSSKDIAGDRKNLQSGLCVIHPSSSSKDFEGSIKDQQVSQPAATPVQPVFVEVFAGCCQLSVSMQQAGFHSIPVDSSKNKHKPRCKVFLLDLNLESARNELKQKIISQGVAAIHVALPCGTGSRARERPIPKHLLKMGAPSPQPLRDAQHLFGLPHLNSADANRVALANELAQFTVELIDLARQFGIFISIENPENSWMWGVLCHFVKLKQSKALSKFWNNMYAVNFANCAHGGERDKKTRFLCSHDWIMSMALPCPKNHVHKPFALRKTSQGWQFDTAQEGEYPELLCQRYAACLQKHLQSLPSASGSKPPPSNLNQSKRHSQLIPEYHRTVFSDSPPTAKHKLLVPGEGGENGAKAKYGIYHTPEQFVKFARTLTHPFDVENRIPDVLRRSIFQMLCGGVQEMANKRLEQSKRLTQLRYEMRFEEARLHSLLSPHARVVLKGKSILLFRHLLEEQGFPDMEVCELLQGVDLVGDASKSPLFGTKLVHATTTPELLLQSSTSANQKILSRNVHETEPELASVLWETTLKECQQGFLEGPFSSVKEVQDLLGCERFVCSRRFVIMQNGKPRVIDDLKESNVNSAYIAIDRLFLHDIDFVSSLAFLISKLCHRDDSHISLSLEDGSVLEGELHRDFRAHANWSIRCLDLAKAYKQVPVSESSRQFGVLVLHDPSSGQPKYVVTRSLPFGACASVFAFNRISRALWFLAVKLMGAVGGCFYDDFPLIEPEITAPIASSSVEHLLDCLGWIYSSDPAKSRPFEEECDVLGVRVNVKSLSHGCLKLANKASRYKRLKDIFNSARKNQSFTKRDAQVVHGTLNFMTSFVMGQSLKLACQVFANLTMHVPSCSFSDIEALFSWTESLMDALEPRILSSSGLTAPILIFTDAAYEDGVATWGCVFVDPASGIAEVSGGTIPQMLISCWQELAGKQVITQAEAFVVFVARKHYELAIRQRRVIFFVDNEAARYSLIHGSSPSVSLLKIVQAFHSCSVADSAIAWLERVPSPSNIADLPSRGLISEAAQFVNGKVVNLDLEVQSLAEHVSCFDGAAFQFLISCANSFSGVADILL